MQPTTISIRRLGPMVVLTLIVLGAFAAGAAGAAGVSKEFVPGVTDFPSRLGEVGDGSGAVVHPGGFVPGVTDFPSRLGEIGERAAEARLLRREQQTPAVTVEENGFDWHAGAT